MSKIVKSILFVATSMFLFSCSKMTPKDYQNNTPKLDIREYLNGKVTAWGMLENRKGKVTRRFTVDIIGTWDGNEGTLDERFVFSDGEKSKRIWKVKFNDDNTFTATAGDVVGESKGEQYGNAMRMEYVLDLVVNQETGKKYKVKLDDWMYLLDENVLVNKSEIKKFGITFGKLTIFFQKS